jgi:hypothetical protein
MHLQMHALRCRSLRRISSDARLPLLGATEQGDVVSTDLV